jgi:hypothetical protein
MEDKNLNKGVTANSDLGAVSCCFFSLIFSTLENNLKISLKKFANSK